MVGGLCASLPPKLSWQALCLPSTTLFGPARKTWVPATRAGMTGVVWGHGDHRLLWCGWFKGMVTTACYGVGGLCASLPPKLSWQALCLPSTTLFGPARKTWAPATKAGMTGERRSFPSLQQNLRPAPQPLSGPAHARGDSGPDGRCRDRPKRDAVVCTGRWHGRNGGGRRNPKAGWRHRQLRVAR